MAGRHHRVASLMKEEIGAILTREYSDPALGLTTVTEVRLSADLRHAKVYFSVLGPAELQERTIAALEAERPRIRSMLASRIRIRFMPELQFVRDDTMDRVDRINKLLKQINDGSAS